MSSSSTLHELICEEVRRCAATFGVRPDEGLSEAFVRILESKDIPREVIDWCREETRKGLQAFARRERRHRSRSTPVGEQASLKATSRAYAPDRIAIAQELEARVRECAKDEFELQAIEVMLRQHPKFSSIGELIASNFGGHAGNGYRKVDKLKDRIRRVITGAA